MGDDGCWTMTMELRPSSYGDQGLGGCGRRCWIMRRAGMVDMPARTRERARALDGGILAVWWGWRRQGAWGSVLCKSWAPKVTKMEKASVEVEEKGQQPFGGSLQASIIFFAPLRGPTMHWLSFLAICRTQSFSQKPRYGSNNWGPTGLRIWSVPSPQRNLDQSLSNWS